MNMRYAAAVLIILLAGCSASHTMNPTDVPLVPQSPSQPRAVAHAIATMPPGALVEYQIPTANSYPYFITAAGDGNLWFTESNKIGRITTAGVITEFGLSATPSHIRTGPDGNPWLGTYSPDSIGRIAYDGSVQLYPIPSPTGHPEELVGDNSRNVIWFVERTGRKVGEFSLATHTFIEFPIPPLPGGYPVQLWAIALDRADNIWFSDGFNNQVDEMSADGTLVQRLTLPAPNGPLSLLPYRMTLGSDGDLWLVESTGGSQSHGTIAKIDPTTGSISTYDPPSSTNHIDDPFDMIAVSGGNWITEYSLPGIAHISNSTGHFKEYTARTTSVFGIGPGGLAVGSDNNLWFPDFINNRIAKVVVSLLP